MTFTEEQIEWIVVEVIRRLGPLTSDKGANHPTNGELRLADRLVTMQLVGGRLDGVRRLIVSKRAVVTPAVKDELRQQKIELVFDEGNTRMDTNRR